VGPPLDVYDEDVPPQLSRAFPRSAALGDDYLSWSSCQDFHEGPSPPASPGAAWPATRRRRAGLRRNCAASHSSAVTAVPAGRIANEVTVVGERL